MCWSKSTGRSVAFPSILTAEATPENCATSEFGEYRESFFKPCRIIYRVVENDVHGLVIADGRRDMRTLLERRLLQA